jgi:hypothetical protein
MIKALTVCQPYAEMLALGPDVKPAENRTWPTRYRGWLAIHAGKSRTWLDEGDLDRYPDMTFGAIVMVGRLVGSPAFDRLSEWHPEWLPVREHPETGGPYCWIITDRCRLERPIPCRGAQGLWIVPNDVVAQVREGFWTARGVR